MKIEFEIENILKEKGVAPLLMSGEEFFRLGKIRTSGSLSAPCSISMIGF